MPIIIRLLVLALCFISMNTMAQQSLNNNFFSWHQIDTIPDADGFAGSYAGVSNNSLLVAGGTNFPGNKRPWTNGTKTWYDKIFVLEKPGDKWKEHGKLLRPMGYGVSLTWKNVVVFLGGGDGKQNYADAFILRYNAGKIETEALPPMPLPLSNSCGVLINDVIYVIGGIHSPTDSTNNNFWKLDLLKPAANQKWEVLEDIPGKSRMLAMAGSQDGKLYLFGGVHLIVSPTDTVLYREYLKDCWEYSPGKGWQKIADLPQPLAAAPSPAYSAIPSNLLLFGGDDGAKAGLVATLKDEHPGFRNDILAYNTKADSWSAIGWIPVQKNNDSVNNHHGSTYAPVTTPLVIWNNDIVIAGGEARPAVRSNKVLVASLLLQPAGKDDKLNKIVMAIFFGAILLISFIVFRRMS